MATARISLLGRLIALLGAAWLLVAASARADEAPTAEDKVLAFNLVTGNDAIEGEIKALVAKPDDTKKLLPVAVALAKKKDTPLNYTGAFILARAAQDLKDIDASEALYRVCVDQATKLQSGQKLAQSLGSLIDLFYDNKKYDKTIKLCREFLDVRDNKTVNNLKPFVMETMIQAMAREGKYDDALKLVENMVKAEEEDGGWWALQLKAWVLYQSGKPKEAAKAYETVLDRLENDKNLKEEGKARYLEKNRYLLSGVYVDLKQIDKAAKMLKVLLDKKPDNPTYNNDLGYIWADHDMNLQEAEKLVRKALDEDRKLRKKMKDLKPEDDKDNSAYLDSLGWVLYKLKKYDEAKKVLLEAVKDKEGQHIEILDHLADVHLALKEKDQAVAAWKKGIEVAGKSKRELAKKAEVEKKLEANK